MNAVNVKLSKADSSFKDGEDGVSHTRPGNHKPGKSDETTTEDHAINTKRTGATKDGRAMLGLKGTALTNGRSVDGSDETNPTPQEHAVNEKGHGNSVKGEESKVIVKIIK